MKMGRYKASIGIWEHKIEGADGKPVVHNIVPREGDNIEFVEIKKKAEKAKDEAVLTKGISQLYFDMVVRSDKTLTEEDKKELKDLIGLNINQIVTDFLIQFKWTTKEKLEEARNEFQKKKIIVDIEEEKQEKKVP